MKAYLKVFGQPSRGQRGTDPLENIGDHVMVNIKDVHGDILPILVKYEDWSEERQAVLGEIQQSEGSKVVFLAPAVDLPNGLVRTAHRRTLTVPLDQLERIK